MKEILGKIYIDPILHPPMARSSTIVSHKDSIELLKLQQSKMREIWDNKEDEFWEEV